MNNKSLKIAIEEISEFDVSKWVVVLKYISHKYLCINYMSKMLFLDKDDCIDVTCSGHGDCSDGIDRYDCTCYLGYTGQVCEIGIYIVLNIFSLWCICLNNF